MKTCNYKKDNIKLGISYLFKNISPTDALSLISTTGVIFIEAIHGSQWLYPWIQNHFKKISKSITNFIEHIQYI